MQCFMKKDDKSPIDAENKKLLISTIICCIGILQFCLTHLSLASLAFWATYFTFLSGVVIVLSCGRYQSQHRCDFCAQIDICVVAVLEVIA